MTVARILQTKSSHIFTERTSEKMRNICAGLARLGIGAMIISDDSRKIDGIISERDIVRALSHSGNGILDQAVSDFMTKKVVTCTPGDSVNSVMARMTEKRFRHMPVVEDGGLVGLVSIGDVVKFHIAQIEREAEDLRNYIAMS